MKISYAILCNDEIAEMKSLLYFLINNIHNEDEICVVIDSENMNEEMLRLLKNITFDRFIWCSRPLRKDFAAQKNFLTSICKGDWLINIDADEMISEYFIRNIPTLLETNEKIDTFYVPRINTVNGLTEEHIKKWGWVVSKNEKFVEEKIIDTDSEEYKLLKQYNLIIEETNI